MTTQDDTTALTEVMEQMSEAWGRNDADAYGASFTADATYVTFVGTYYSGRADIVACHRTLFAKFLKNTKLASEITDIRFYGPDTAVVTSRGDTYKGATPPKASKLSKVQSCTFVREGDGQWRIAAFQNTQRKPLMEAISFKTAPGTIPAAQRQ
ncbi:SgcJ/EcaC family oxidoreductase [Rhodococcus spelaei]|uniref:SgcJ/EcaC family oxidoreductase n=1 Tax=Rhodococcus spelaei TaxID=2546320 RepID=A0A541B223_9NOCA|nr:SgcJ/EcaC family oxidoreductase [Rhodococcus spelaei]TQF66361.1 SgcJ/EcaC family oxidoreductase [Rhodococcus spelaei]